MPVKREMLKREQARRDPCAARPVTYSLRPDFQDPEIYYAEVRRFTDEALLRAQVPLMPTVERFMEYLRTFRLEEVRKPEEYVLEVLSFGLLWNSYGGYALAVRRAPFVTLARMAEWRKRHQRLKPAIDIARGVLTTLFLLPRRGATRPQDLPRLPQVDRLCLWLEATGEFREQALRFVRWRAFWDSMPEEERRAMASNIFSYCAWFIHASEAALGKYTARVDRFIEEAGTHYRWREDRIQCTRSRAEYHLNMVGAEIMNRAFAGEFRNRDATAVLLPGCMRGRPESECEAIRVKEGLRCNGCLPSCHVNQLRQMGAKRGFEVYIIPHASDLSLWSPRPGQPSRGVVAAACVTTLVEGGWELKRYDVAAQCVLLECSGCRKHWHPEGFPTRLNIRELKRLLDNRQTAVASAAHH